MAKIEHDVVMTIDDLADYLKLSKSTLYKLCQRGEIPGQKVGRHWRFRMDTINRWLERDCPGIAASRGKDADA